MSTTPALAPAVQLDDLRRFRTEIEQNVLVANAAHKARVKAGQTPEASGAILTTEIQRIYAEPRRKARPSDTVPTEEVPQ